MSGIGSTFDKELRQRIFVLYGERDLGYVLTLSTNQSTLYVGDILHLSGSLAYGGNPIGNAYIEIYQDNTLLTSTTTEQDGTFTKNIKSLPAGSYIFRAVYNNEQSNTVTVNVYAPVHTFTLTASCPSTAYINESVSITGTLVKDGVGYSGQTVTIKDGNSTVATLTTDANGGFSTSVSNFAVGVHDIYATYESIESTHTSLTISKKATDLSINVPAHIVYSDNFLITGTLTDANNNTLSSKAVGLKVGNTVVDTQNTNNNGVVTFNRSPVSMGTHTFQLVYDGDSTYIGSESQSVTKQVEKETSSINVTSPTNNLSTYSSTVTITGTLTTDDNEKISGKSIVVSEEGTTLKTITTDSNGAFNNSVSLGSGSHTLTIGFGGDDYYTASSVQRTVTVLSESLTVQATADIIDIGSTTTLTATYIGQTVSGKQVTFKKGSTVLDTVTTDSNGQANYTYTGTGEGDITITVECMNLQEIFVLEDCITYDPLTSASGKWTIPSGVSSTYSSDGWTVSATSYGQVRLTDKLTSDCSVEFTLVNYNIVSAGASCLVCAYTNGETTPNTIILDSRGSSYSVSEVLGRSLDHRFANGTKFKIEYTSSTLKVYENDVLIGTDTNSVGLPTRFEFHIGGGGRTATYKDLKVKAL